MPRAMISFRCAGRSDRSELHVIQVTDRQAECSCQGTDWCSHIDATLLAGERHMVPDADRPAADRAMAMVAGVLRPPRDWQASWREDRVWRGLAPPRSGDAARAQWDGRPTICFIGSGPAGNRTEYVTHAKSLGWRVVEQPTQLTTLVVCSAEGLDTKRGMMAMDMELPTIDHEEFSEWIYDLTNEVFDRIEHHGHDTQGGLRAA